jgi:hypothetical protein
MGFTRREFGRVAVASVPMCRAFGAKMIDSKFEGVQIGAINYTFNRIDSPHPEEIVKAFVEIGLGEAELMSDHCEALAGAPRMPTFGRGAGAVPGPSRRRAADNPAGRLAGREKREHDAPAGIRRSPSNRPRGRPRWRNWRDGARRRTPVRGRASERDLTTPASKSRCSATTWWTA